jgi:hypothetical protein
MNKLFKYLLIAFAFLSLSMASAQVTPEQVAGIENGQTLKIEGQVMVKEAITISGKKDITLTGSRNAEIVTFNSEPHVLRFENCENVKVENMKIRFGIEGVGGPVIVLKNTKNITLDNLDLGGFGEMVLDIDAESSSIKVLNSKIHDCQEMGLRTKSADLEIRECTFYSNSKIGRHKPDMEIQCEEAYPLIRFNEYRVSEYIKHKTTVDQFVESRNTIGYNFDCFKIVKKYETAKGEEGKVTAFYEGENNKILDKLELEYKGPKGQVTATAYYLHGNLVFTSYEVRKGKIDLNYLVYGDFLEHLKQADSKSAAHVSGDPSSNREQYKAWLKTLDAWKAYLFDEAEEWELYKNKDSFITLPY